MRYHIEQTDNRAITEFIFFGRPQVVDSAKLILCHATSEGELGFEDTVLELLRNYPDYILICCYPKHVIANYHLLESQVAYPEHCGPIRGSVPQCDIYQIDPI